MTMIEQARTTHLTGPDAASVAHLFQALSDPTRLAIVQHLTLGEHRVRDLVAHLGLAQSTVSVHIARLRDCGLVTTRPRGRSTVVTLTAPDALGLLLEAARRNLATTGHTADEHHRGAGDRAAS